METLVAQVELEVFNNTGGAGGTGGVIETQETEVVVEEINK